MGLKSYKPTSSARRHMTVADFAEITRSKPEKKLTKTVKRTGGRNNHGHITTRHIGGGHKRRYRIIDWRRDKDGVPAKVASIEYDPNRTSRLALLHYKDGEKRYILAPRELTVGQTVMSGDDAEPRPGNCLPLKNVPLGLFVHSVELVPGKGGQIGRAAGAQVQLAAREQGMAQLIMPSGETRLVPEDCRATVGQVGNVDAMLVKWGKAGRSRHRGKRPHVRGSAMNPYSHPLGGGEGRSGAGRPPCSPWGKLAKGGKTRKRKKWSNRLILRRRTK
jgi:large subunit ribosomal protein L2